MCVFVVFTAVGSRVKAKIINIP